MSLLDDLSSLDVSAIVNAKADLRGALDVDALNALVSDGAPQRILGDLGTTIDAFRGGLDDPSQLLAPLGGILEEVLEAVDLGDLPLGDYLGAVREGAEILQGVIGALNGDMSEIAPIGAAPLGRLIEGAGGPVADHARKALDGVGRYRALLDTVESGMPSDPTALANLAIDVLLPFPRASLGEIRSQVEASLSGLDAIGLPTTTTQGLVTALVEVRVAAEAGDPARVQAALAQVERLRGETVSLLADGLRRVSQAISGLRLDLALEAVSRASGALRSAELGALEELESWRQRIAEMRRMVEELDAERGLEMFGRILDEVEAEARSRLNEAIDAQIARLVGWLRGLLREIPLRELRGEISQAVLGLADAIRGLGIDSVAGEIKAQVDQLTSLLENADLGALVGDATQEVEDAVKGVLDQLEATLGTITAEIDAVAAQAQTILERAVQGIAAFRGSVDAVSQAVSEAGIEEATQEVIEALAALRENAEELLGVAPLPDSMRPLVEQLVDALEGIDLDAVIGDPLREVAAQLQLPQDIADSVSEGLQTLSEVISSLIPTAVIDELEAELDALIGQIGQLDLSELTSGISGVLDEAAGFVESIDPMEAAEPVGEVFDRVLAAFDEVHPHKLLKPVIDAYDGLLGQLPVPDPGTITTRAAQLSSAANEAAARIATQPLAAAAGSGATVAPARGADPAGAGDEIPAGNEPPPTDLRPGDIVRVFGFLPEKLREGLQALESGPAGEVLGAVHQMCGGLAANIRRLQQEVGDVGRRVDEALDAALAPLAEAQIDAQLALQAGFSASAGDGALSLDVDASVLLLASAGPAALRKQLSSELGLVGERVGGAANALAGEAAAKLDATATLLEQCLLADLGEDLDRLLAALDPEPIAAEMDAFVAAIVDAVPEVVAALETQIEDLGDRVRALVAEFNPGRQAQKLLVVFDVLREELELLNPRRLADELGEVHAAIRSAIEAYDPRRLAQELVELLEAAAVALRSLDPANLLPDMSGIQAQLERVPALLPTDALQGVGAGLEQVGDELLALDVQQMLDTVNQLAPAVTEALMATLEAVKREIQTLLESIRYASGSASASVSVGAGG